MLPAILLVPVLALWLSARQQKKYAANAQVLISYTNVADTLNGLANPSVALTPTEIVATQAALARNPAVAQRALSLSGVRSTPTEFLKRSSVSALTNADLLDFSVTDPKANRAVRLATNYAKAYTMYRGELDSQAINAALASVTQRLDQLPAADQSGPTYKALSHEQQVLTAAQAAATNDAVLVQPAESAAQVEPRPTRSLAVGLIIGIALALGLAFLLEALDTRASSEEIERRLGLPLLARIPAPARWRRVAGDQTRFRRGGRAARADADPAPPRRGRGPESLATLGDPNGRQAEAFRVLKSGLDFASLEHNLKSILITGGCEYEGNSTTVANLAVSLIQSGRRVLVCDLNGRRPTIADIFGLRGLPGITEVVLGEARLDEAIVTIPAQSLLSRARAADEVEVTSDQLDPATDLDGTTDEVDGTSDKVKRTDTHVVDNKQGLLGVLPFGYRPAPNPGIVSSRAVGDLVEELKDRTAHADHLLIRGPALLPHRVALTLSAHVDAVIVALAAPVPRLMLDELARTLSTSATRPLGFITVGAFPDGNHGIGSTGHYLEQQSPSDIGLNGNGHVSVPHSLTHG